jgi:hypothetical protein
MASKPVSSSSAGFAPPMSPAMSRPAQKASPSPVTTTHRTSSSWASSRTRSAIALEAGASIAFRRSGFDIVTVATAPSRVVSTLVPDGHSPATSLVRSPGRGAYHPGGPPAGMERDRGEEDPPDGLVTVRGAIGGVALLWLAAMAGFGALQASVYAARVAPVYAAVAVAAAGLSIAAGYGSLRSFGLA